MKKYNAINYTTIGDTEFTYSGQISIEDETFEEPGSQDVEIKDVVFDGEFNPYEIKAVKEFSIKEGQNLAEFVAKNFKSFTCDGEDIEKTLAEHAIEILDID